MMRKKGMLLKNVLTLLIAIIGIALVFYGVYKFYQQAVSQEEEQAKDIINVVEARINAIDDGQTGKFVIRGVEKWALVGWSKDDASRPDKCFFESCICICDIGLSTTGFTGGDVYNPDGTIRYSPEPFPFGERCQEKGFCRFFGNKNLKTDSSYFVVETIRRNEYLPFSDNLAGYVNEHGEEPPKYHRGAIILPKNKLIELSIKKTGDLILITS